MVVRLDRDEHREAEAELLRIEHRDPPLDHAFAPRAAGCASSTGVCDKPDALGDLGDREGRVLLQGGRGSCGRWHPSLDGGSLCKERSSIVATPGEEYSFSQGSVLLGMENIYLLSRAIDNRSPERFFADPYTSFVRRIDHGRVVASTDTPCSAAIARPSGSAARRVSRCRGRVVFTTSFGLEDQALTHAIPAPGARDRRSSTLDTGGCFPRPTSLGRDGSSATGCRIVAFAPRARRRSKPRRRADGINGFRNSVEARKACCGIRKVEPLGRALAGAAGWITGLRAEQSRHRAGTPFAAFDAALRRSSRSIRSRIGAAATSSAYVADHRVPYNPLHDRGFPSIGCAPCTRAVRVGEPERAGRWWWEDDGKKECGLHLRPVAAVRPRTPFASRGAACMSAGPCRPAAVRLPPSRRPDASPAARGGEHPHPARGRRPRAENPVLLYSIGKDSSVLLHLARRRSIPDGCRSRSCTSIRRGSSAR